MNRNLYQQIPPLQIDDDEEEFNAIVYGTPRRPRRPVLQSLPPISAPRGKIKYTTLDKGKLDLGLTTEEPKLPERLKYYCPAVTEDDSDDKGLYPPTEFNKYNLESSLCDDGKHRPALDIDVPVDIVASSTPGHYHLMFPTIALTWEEYQELLEVLGKYGLVDKYWVKHSKERSQTCLRPPHVKKTQEQLEKEAIKRMEAKLAGKGDGGRY